MKAVLTYHSIDRSGSVISTPPAVFEAQLAWLAQSPIRVLDLSSLLADEEPGPALALTFDDGFANLATDAWPRLADRGMPACVFVPTALVGGTNAWDAGSRAIPQLPLLDWDGLGRLAEAGLGIEAHGRTHRRLTTLVPEAADEEIREAMDAIASHVGRRPQGLAYPYGAHNSSVIRAAASHCRWACTTEFRPLRAGDSPHRVPRLDAYYFRDPRTLESWGRLPFRLRVTAIGALRTLRRVGTH